MEIGPLIINKQKELIFGILIILKYYDFSLVSAGTCVLGYSDSDVNKASIKAIKSGSISTLNPPEDVELAEVLLKDHKWAGGVRYVRGGGEIMRIAIRLARAFTKKEKILFCGYHGWHDWYLAANHKSKKNLDFQLLPGLKTIICSIKDFLEQSFHLDIIIS